MSSWLRWQSFSGKLKAESELDLSRGSSRKSSRRTTIYSAGDLLDSGHSRKSRSHQEDAEKASSKLREILEANRNSGSESEEKEEIDEEPLDREGLHEIFQQIPEDIGASRLSRVKNMCLNCVTTEEIVKEVIEGEIYSKAIGFSTERCLSSTKSEILPSYCQTCYSLCLNLLKVINHTASVRLLEEFERNAGYSWFEECISCLINIKDSYQQIDALLTEMSFLYSGNNNHNENFSRKSTRSKSRQGRKGLNRNLDVLSCFARVIVRTIRENSSVLEIISKRLIEFLEMDPENYFPLLKSNLMEEIINLVEKMNPQQLESSFAVLIKLFESRAFLYSLNTMNIEFPEKEIQFIADILQRDPPKQLLSQIYSSLNSILKIDSCPDIHHLSSKFDLLEITLSFVFRHSDAVSSVECQDFILESDAQLLMVLLQTLESFLLVCDEAQVFVALSRYNPLYSLLDNFKFTEILISIFKRALTFSYTNISSTSDSSFEASKSISQSIFRSLLQSLQESNLGVDTASKILWLLEDTCKVTTEAKRDFFKNDGFRILTSFISSFYSTVHGRGGRSQLDVVFEVLCVLNGILTQSLEARNVWRSSVGYAQLCSILGGLQFDSVDFSNETICIWLIKLACGTLNRDFYSAKILPQLKILISSESLEKELEVASFPDLTSGSVHILDGDLLSNSLVFLFKAPRNFQLFVYKFLNDMVSSSDQSLDNLSETGFLLKLLKFYKPRFLEVGSVRDPLLNEISKLIRSLGKFRPSTSEVHEILEFVEGDTWGAFIDTLIEMVAETRAETFILMDCSQDSKPYIRCSANHVKAWPPSQGYSLSAWVYIDCFDNNVDTPLRLFSFSNSESRSYLLDAYIHRSVLVVQLASKKNRVIEFKKFQFKKGCWYNLILIHQHNLIISSTLSLYVNCQLVDTQESPYLSSGTSEFFVGENPRSSKSGNFRWKLAGLACFDCCLNEKMIQQVFNSRGGIFLQSRSVFERDVLKDYDIVSKAIQSALKDNSTDPEIYFKQRDFNTELRRLSMRVDLNTTNNLVSRNNLVISLNPRQSWQMSASFPSSDVVLDAKSSLLTDSIQYSTVLFNSGRSDVFGNAYLCDGGRIQRPYGLADGIHYFGGLPFLFPLVEKCDNSEMLNKLLLLLGYCMGSSPTILYGMNHGRNYQILAYLLKAKAHLFDSESVRLLWGFVGLYNRGYSGKISNVSALSSFFGDNELWGNAIIEVRECMLLWILNLVSPSNPNFKDNLDRLRTINPVFWILKLISSEKLVDMAAQLLRTIITSTDLVEEEFKLILDFIFASRPSSNDNFQEEPLHCESTPRLILRNFVLSSEIRSSSVKNILLEAVLHIVIWAANCAFPESNREDLMRTKNSKHLSWSLILKHLDFEYLLGLIEEDDNILSRSKTVIIVLKILDVLFTHEPSVLKDFRSKGGFSSLKLLLTPFCGLENIYASLLCLLMQKNVSVNVPHHQDYKISENELSLKEILSHSRDSSFVSSCPEIIHVICHLLWHHMEARTYVYRPREAYQTFKLTLFFIESSKNNVTPSKKSNSRDLTDESFSLQAVPVRPKKFRTRSISIINSQDDLFSQTPPGNKLKSIEIIVSDARLDRSLFRILSFTLRNFPHVTNIFSSDEFLVTFSNCILHPVFILNSKKRSSCLREKILPELKTRISGKKDDLSSKRKSMSYLNDIDEIAPDNQASFNHLPPPELDDEKINFNAMRSSNSQDYPGEFETISVNDPAFRAMVDISMSIIMYHLRFSSRSCAGDFFLRLMHFTPAEKTGSLKISFQEIVLESLAKTFSVEGFYRELQQNSKILENFLRLSYTVSLSLFQAELSCTSVYKYVLVFLNALKGINSEDEGGAKRIQESSYASLLRIIKKCIIYFFRKVDSDNDMRASLLKVILDSEEVLCDSSDPDVPFCLSLLEICLNDLLLSSRNSKSHESDTFTHYVLRVLSSLYKCNKSLIEEGFVKSHLNAQDMSLFCSGMSLLMVDDLQIFFDWLHVNCEFMIRILESEVKKISNAYLKGVESEIVNVSSSSRDLQLHARNFFALFSFPTEDKLLRLVKDLSFKRLEARKGIIFRIFQSRQALRDVNQQLKVELNSLLSKNRVDRLLRSLRLNLDQNSIKCDQIFSVFFPNENWKLDFTLGTSQNIRKKILHSELDFTVEQKRSIESFDEPRFCSPLDDLRSSTDSGSNGSQESSTICDDLAKIVSSPVSKILMKSMKKTRDFLSNTALISDAEFSFDYSDKLGLGPSQSDDLFSSFDDVPIGPEGSSLSSGGPLVDAELSKEKLSDSLLDEVDDYWIWKQGYLKLLVDTEDNVHDLFNCSRIDLLDEIPGTLLLCQNNFYYIDGYQVKEGVEQEKDDVKEYFDSKKKDSVPEPGKQAITRQERKKFKFSDIAMIHKRRYLLQPAAIEIVLCSGLNLLLVFDVRERNIVYKLLLRSW